MFCIHAGLSPDVPTIDQVNVIDRRIEVPAVGPLADLLWSDPEPKQEVLTQGWGPNPRGAGYIFGENIVDEVN